MKFGILSTSVKILIVVLSVVPKLARAEDRLLYFEVQGISGYSFKDNKLIYHSLMSEDVMQKSSIGVDYVQKLSNSGGDFGTIAVQGRLSLDKDGRQALEPQIYNAFFKYKASMFDIWVGHNRPAFGLSSYFDTHALLLPTLVMYGIGYDRDWGTGIYRDFSWGNVNFSGTLGSGMSFRVDKNYLLSGRISKGTLNQENYNLGLSFAFGRTLDTMGYKIMSHDKLETKVINADFTYLYNNIENRIELTAGTNGGRLKAAFNRTSFNISEEAKIEYQTVWYKNNGKPSFIEQQETLSNRALIFSLGGDYILTSDLALRIMYQRPITTSNNVYDNRIILQLYFYKKT